MEHIISTETIQRKLRDRIIIMDLLHLHKILHNKTDPESPFLLNFHVPVTFLKRCLNILFTERGYEFIDKLFFLYV